MNVRADGKLAKVAKKRVGMALSAKGWTREQLAEELAVHPDTVGHWLGGRGAGGLTVRMLQRLCNLLDLSPNQLLLEDAELEFRQREEALQVARHLVDAMLLSDLETLQRREHPDTGGGAPRAG